MARRAMAEEAPAVAVEEAPAVVVEEAPSAVQSLIDSEKQDNRQNAVRISKDPPAEVQADNAIRDNFGGWDPKDIYGKLIDGKTLYQVILEGKVANKNKKKTVVMGMLFYDKLRRKYADMHSIAQLLKSDDPNAKIRPKLFSAMGKAMFQKPPRRGDMISYVETMEEVTQPELCGILRWIHSLRPTLSTEQLNGGLIGMQAISRLKLREKHAEMIEIMKPVFADILAAVLCN